MTLCAVGQHTGRVKQPERHRSLINLLHAQGELSVAELAERLSVGAATVRRDLQTLAASGRVVRTYGGATTLGSGSMRRSIAPEIAWKRRIGAAAADLVRDGQTIVISSGSTALEFARQLVDRERLTVVTNALDVAGLLQDRDGIELIVLGGHVRRGMHSLLGHLTELAADQLRGDMLFMSVKGVSVEDGLMNDHMPEILTDRALRRMARDVILMADATKFDRLGPGFVFGIDEVSTIVTDSRVRPETLDALREKGINVVVATGPSEHATEAASSSARSTGERFVDYAEAALEPAGHR